MIKSWLMYGLGKTDFHNEFLANNHVTLDARQRYKKLLDFDTLPQYYYEDDYIRPDPPAGNTEMWNAIKGLALDPYFAPGMAENLQGLPKTYMMTAGQDPRRDETVIFARRLRGHGYDISNVVHEYYPTIVHGEVFKRHQDIMYFVGKVI